MSRLTFGNILISEIFLLIGLTPDFKCFFIKMISIQNQGNFSRYSCHGAHLITGGHFFWTWNVSGYLISVIKYSLRLCDLGPILSSTDFFTWITTLNCLVKKIFTNYGIIQIHLLPMLENYKHYVSKRIITMGPEQRACILAPQCKNIPNQYIVKCRHKDSSPLDCLPLPSS
jgi:hypothetical protein